jgi:hypothetical protein
MHEVQSRHHVRSAISLAMTEGVFKLFSIACRESYIFLDRYSRRSPEAPESSMATASPASTEKRKVHLDMSTSAHGNLTIQIAKCFALHYCWFDCRCCRDRLVVSYHSRIIHTNCLCSRHISCRMYTRPISTHTSDP